MTVPLSPLLSAPLLLSLTLLVSGGAKFMSGHRPTQDAMVSLRLPLRRWHGLGAVALPVVEVALALALWTPVVPVQVIVAVLVALLMVTYLVIIARALSFPDPVECSCFGTLGSPTVSRGTLARNIVLTLLGLVTIASAAAGTITDAVRQAPLGVLGWAVGLALAVVLTVLVRGGTNTAPRPRAEAPQEHDAPPDEGDEEYERLPVPFGMLREYPAAQASGEAAPADGRVLTLDEAMGQGAQLMIWVSPGCGPCERVLNHVPDWADALEPLVQVRTMFRTPPPELAEGTLSRAGHRPSHDVESNVGTALGTASFPSAVLLGTDGLTAGGPVLGASAVEEFVGELLAAVEAGG